MSFHSKAWAWPGSPRPGSNLSPPPTSFVMLGLHLLYLLCQLPLSLPGLKGLGLCFVAEALLNALFFQSTKQRGDTQKFSLQMHAPPSFPLQTTESWSAGIVQHEKTSVFPLTPQPPLRGEIRRTLCTTLNTYHKSKWTKYAQHSKLKSNGIL